MVLHFIRWLKKFKIYLASEQKQRALAHEIVDDNMEVERAAFLFSKEGGGEEIRVLCTCRILCAKWLTC